MLITAMNDVPGYIISEVYGEVFGVAIRYHSRFKSIESEGTEGMNKILVAFRQESQDRLMKAAEAKGANAVIAFRFDNSDFAGYATEICASGTAVAVEKEQRSAP